MMLLSDTLHCSHLPDQLSHGGLHDFATTIFRPYQSQWKDLISIMISEGRIQVQFDGGSCQSIIDTCLGTKEMLANPKAKIQNFFAIEDRRI